MKQISFWDKRFPTVLGLLLLLIGVSVTVWIANHSTNAMVRADTTIIPENIRVTNVSDTSFTISFSTKKAAAGTIAYGIDSTVNKVAFDDRDNNEKTLTPYMMHHITIKSLQPQSKYFFAILVDGREFLNNNAYFETTTAPQLSTTQIQTTAIKGKLAFPNTFEETIVYVTNQNSQTFSTLVKPDGSYEIPLTSLRTRDLLTFFIFPDDEILQMLFISPLHESIVTITGQEKGAVPLVLLSESYDFTLSPKPGVLSVFDEKVSFPILDKKKAIKKKKSSKLEHVSITPRTTPQAQ